MPTAKKIRPDAEAEDSDTQARGRERRMSGSRMTGEDLARLRASLGKSQRELSELLGLSLKAVESYEQGWRNVPAHVERLLYFLLFKLNEDQLEAEEPCWESKACPEETRAKCVAFVAKEGRFCWFFTGRLCAGADGVRAESAAEGRGCYECDMFSRMLARVEEGAR